jgi:hypothetical protein
MDVFSFRSAARCGTLAIALVAASFVAAAAATTIDGAVIENSGSTNGAGWRMVIRSSGQATTQVLSRHGPETGPASQSTPAPFTPDPALVETFFRDVRAARDSNEPPATCMKSASFGSRTMVLWHGWSSGDLSCPGNTGAMGALAQDVSALQSAGHVTPLPLYRRAPIEIRATPATSPTPHRALAAREGAAARQSHRR